jgi:hypothetical protein
MSGPSEIPSPLEVLARIDAALEASGLKSPGAEREPLPLYWQLLNEWLISQHQPEIATADEATLTECLRQLPPAAVRKALQRIRNEALDLCRAHKTLNDWNQRDMESLYQRLLLATARPDQAAGAGF